MRVLPFMANYGRELRIEQILEEKKSNRVCKENKESTRESRSSIEKGTRRHKKASR